MSDVPLLVDTAIALAYALAGGLLARRAGLPTLVGYMVAGIAIGPFTPGYRGDARALEQLAEFGVILLMFGVGLHFSFRDLWRVRRVAIPGAVIQMAVISVAGYALARRWDFAPPAAWMLGIAVSVSSTVVMTRALMDHGWLDSPPGKVAMGWLIFEDLLTVAVLVLLPAIVAPASAEAQPAVTVGIALGKAALFIGLMLFIGVRVMPAVLGRIAGTRSRELFVLTALTVGVGTALASAAWFDVSLALGAFVAGVVVSETEFSHQIGADLLPFREAFAVLFFVSVGMLVDPRYVVAHWDRVLAITVLIMAGKALVSGLLGAILPAPGRTALVLAAGRSQIGEFSFIVGQTGVALGVLSVSDYSLVLSGAIISITANTFMFRLIDPVERALKRRPALWRAINRGTLPVPDPRAIAMHDHVVIVGCGRVGRHIAEALGRLSISRLVVEADPARVTRLQELDVPTLFGDAGNSEILAHARLGLARAVVITLPDDAAAMAVARTVRDAAPDVRIVARASTWDGARRLKSAGVDDVVRPELEGGVEIVRRTLLDLELPALDVQRYVELVRNEGMDESDRPSAAQAHVLDQLVRATRGVDVVWIQIAPDSALVNRTIADSGLRAQTHASIVGIARGDVVEVNPSADARLGAGDRVAVIGTTEQIRKAEALLNAAP